MGNSGMGAMFDEAGGLKLWSWIGLAVGLFCIVRGIVDMRDHRYLWGSIGILAGLALIMTPIPTHAVKIDLVQPTDR